MITTAQFSMLESLFDYYNKELFEGKLNDCLINMNCKKSYYGWFRPESWYNSNNAKEKNIHEISINTDHFNDDDIKYHQTLVHEMVHLWQHVFGKRSRSGYHNKEWAQKMEAIGLIPSSTGKEGGAKTGQKMADYVDPNGLFIKMFNLLEEKKVKYKPTHCINTVKNNNGSATKDRTKTKYTCSCKNNVWGKPNLLIICGVCKKNYIEEPK